MSLGYTGSLELSLYKIYGDSGSSRYKFRMCDDATIVITNNHQDENIGFKINFCFSGNGSSFKIGDDEAQNVKFRYLNTTVGGQFIDAVPQKIGEFWFIPIITDPIEIENVICVDEICVPVQAEAVDDDNVDVDFASIGSLAIIVQQATSGDLLTLLTTNCASVGDILTALNTESLLIQNVLSTISGIPGSTELETNLTLVNSSINVVVNAAPVSLNDLIVLLENGLTDDQITYLVDYFTEKPLLCP